MNKIDSFKSFMCSMPSIRDDVLNGRYTWQQLYEIYDLYGEDDKFWNSYRKPAIDISSLIDILKNVDLNALSKSFEGIQKILDLISDLAIKDEKVEKQWYDN